MKIEDIDNRIERVVESVGAKRAAMHQWESNRILLEKHRELKARKWRTYGIPVAASLVVICGICLGIFLHRGGGADYDYGVTSTAPIYRGGSFDISEIQSMIDSAQYDKALRAIDITLADTVIDPSFTEERQDYLRSLNVNREYELIWRKIQILVKTKKIDEAKFLLNEYVNSDGVHQTEAKDLLNKLSR